MTTARRAALVLAVAAMTAAGCSDGGGSAGDVARGQIDCINPAPDLLARDWIDACAYPGSQPSTPPPAGPDLPFGQPAVTAGAKNPVAGPGGGTLEITPVAAVYRTADGINRPDSGLFLTVGFKNKAVDGTPKGTAPIEGGGWTYIAPDGQALEQGNGSHAFSVTANNFNDVGPYQPGTFSYDAETWDISEAQRGGTILYTDGDGKTYRWTVPAQDGGPEVEKLKTDLG